MTLARADEQGGGGRRERGRMQEDGNEARGKRERSLQGRGEGKNESNGKKEIKNERKDKKVKEGNTERKSKTKRRGRFFAKYVSSVPKEDSFQDFSLSVNHSGLILRPGRAEEKLSF